jgi:hypothetical protein
MPVIVTPDFSYPDLVDQLEGYLNRTDYTTRIPFFIQMTEEELNDVLDDPKMEVTYTGSTAGQFIDLPDDFGEIKSINVGGYRLTGATVADFSGFRNVAGIPRNYGIYNGQIAFAPVPATGSGVTMVYTRRIPPLNESNPTNWLLARASRLYLYGALIQASIYGWDDERVPGFITLFDKGVAQLQASAEKRRWGAAPLAPRLGRT